MAGLEKSEWAGVGCLESKFVSLEAIEYPACSPKSSSNGTHLSDLFKAEGGELRHAGFDSFTS